MEKLPLEKAERDWDWANVRDMLYPLIDAVNLLSTQNEKECPAGTKKHLNYLESHNYCSHCHATKEEPKEVDVERLCLEVFYLGMHYEKQINTDETLKRRKEIINILKALKQ